MERDLSEYLPKWRRELEIFMKMKSVLILEGNLLDQYRYPHDGDIPAGSVVPLPQYLHSFLWTPDMRQSRFTIPFGDSATRSIPVAWRRLTNSFRRPLPGAGSISMAEARPRPRWLLTPWDKIRFRPLRFWITHPVISPLP